MKHKDFSHSELEKLASLSKLSLSKQELEALTPQLNSILHFVEKVNECNTENVVPTVQESFFGQELRSDEVSQETNPQSILANAPNQGQEQSVFFVPKVIEQS